MLTSGDLLLVGLGKMGQGIAELLIDRMAQEALDEGKFSRVLTCVDPIQAQLVATRHRLEKRGRSFAEKMIVPLRKKFHNGTSNQEIVESFVSNLLDHCLFERGLEACKEALFVFEAAAEDLKIKTDLFTKLSKQLPKEALFFTNTSAIPIKELEKPIVGRLAGLHFYNPPPVQPIIEVVVPANAHPKLSLTISELLAGWKKEEVLSPDIPGFIGNGFMIPEIEMALSMLSNHSVEELNQMTREKLGRPLGIFELVDFVGRDIVIAIGKVMGKDLSGVSRLPPPHKLAHHKKIGEAEVVEKINQDNDPLLQDYLKGLNTIASNLIEKGVLRENLEKVLKQGFHHSFVPWDKRLKR